jgi:hypothetical protein
VVVRLLGVLFIILGLQNCRVSERILVICGIDLKIDFGRVGRRRLGASGKRVDVLGGRGLNVLLMLRGHCSGYDGLVVGELERDISLAGRLAYVGQAEEVELGTF